MVLLAKVERSRNNENIIGNEIHASAPSFLTRRDFLGTNYSSRARRQKNFIDELIQIAPAKSHDDILRTGKSWRLRELDGVEQVVVETQEILWVGDCIRDLENRISFQECIGNHGVDADGGAVVVDGAVELEAS